MLTKFQPTLDGEARLLILIEAFSKGTQSLQGRTKLAKLDFFLRYPDYLERGLAIRKKEPIPPPKDIEWQDIETRMVRYKYGPWDPSYFAILGRLIGKGLVSPVPFERGIGYKVTEMGREVSAGLEDEPIWKSTKEGVTLLRRHFNLTGTTLKNFIYTNFPEVTQAKWGETL